MGFLSRAREVANMPVGILCGIGIGWVVIWFVFRAKVSRLKGEIKRCEGERDDYRRRLNDSNVGGF